MLTRSIAVLAAGVFAVHVCSAVAQAAEAPGVGWEVTSTVFPADLAPAGGTGVVEVTVENIGILGSSGTVTVTDQLPAGVVATEAGDVQEGDQINPAGFWECLGIGTSLVTCTNTESLLTLPIRQVSREPNAGYGAFGHIGIAVKVETKTPETLLNHVTIAGGGAVAPASTATPITISAAPAPFGFQQSDGWFSSENGTVDTQAGSHPYAFTYEFTLNTTAGNPKGLAPAGGEARDLTFKLPPGFVGNPTAVPECPRQLFEEYSCPASSQVGIDVPGVLGGQQVAHHDPPGLPVFNLVPPPDVAAQFAFDLFSRPTYLDASVRSGGDYGITEHVDNIPQSQVMSNIITLWGEPSDPSHNEDRRLEFEPACQFGCETQAPRVPFLTLPTACPSVAPVFSTSSNTWEAAGFGESAFETHDSNDLSTGFTGCDHLGFDPSISVAPDTVDADTPAGLTVDVRVPQEGLTATGGLATSNIKDTTVVLPAGVVINPGQAAGLQACQQGDVVGGDDLPLSGENGEEERFSGPADCPNASRVGEVDVETPLLSKPLQGDVYVLQSNPPHLKMLITASGEGVNLKLVGDVSLCETVGEVLDGHVCEAAGQLVTRIAEAPELPFTNFRLSFSGGAQAALDTPTQCGSYTASSDFTPWSSPAVGDAFPSSQFAVSSGPDGSPCPGGVLPFSPSMIAGSTTDQAGGFTGFSLLLQRGDGQQRIEKLSFKQPQGLSGMISSVPLCDEAAANAGTCPASSQIGHAVVTSGPGPYPLVLPQPEAPELPIYLTGPYQGAPFGLSIVTPVVAGPFNLGTIITRARIEIDPRTAQISITTNPLPQTIDGVPTDLHSIDSVIDRPGFLFNPTNCDPQAFSGKATSAGGVATAPLSSPFQVGSCRSLEFHPAIAASTAQQASKADGAGVVFKITYPKAAQGTQSWLREVKFDLPAQLPARLTTIQKACLAVTFETDRAACPAASIIGHAVVRTQVLPVPLEGPVYFVSYGSAKFPEAVLVLKGDGVTIEEHGETFINSRTGVTSATFKGIPDDPFESVEVNIPAGPYSEFGTNIPPKDHYHLCGQNLKMPTLFIAQNGLETHQNTPITITGCPKTKTRAQQLTAALKACKKDKNKAKRASCETNAHKKYAQAAKSSRRTGKRKGKR
jgi:hypothetical protein